MSECEGIAGTSPEFGTVWHADDAAYRKRFAWQGIDWLTYGDMSGHGLSVTTDVFGRRVFLYREVGLGIHNVKRHGVYWRVISKRGCRALRVTARMSLPARFRCTSRSIR